MNEHIVILTGAGISAESGISTFRDNNGLWEQHAIEDVATPEAFVRDPALVYRFYNLRRKQLTDSDITPNAAHLALAHLKREFIGQVTLITQNVDNLHERAGHEDVIHMHGELLSAKCTHSHRALEWKDSLDHTNLCTCCSKPQALRPNIVWFGEMPMHMDDIYAAVASATLFVAIGTSGNVYPAAGFVDIARQSGTKTMLINLENTGNSAFDEYLSGNATQCVPTWVEQTLSR